MAYFVDQAQTGGTAAITAIAMSMPSHQSGDVLICHVTVDSGTATFAGSVFSALPGAPANPITQGIISYIVYRVATSGAETITLTTADAYTCSVYCFRNVDNTTPFSGVTPLHVGVATATTTPVNSSVTTTQADDLIVYLVSQDGTTPQVLSDPGVMSIYNADSTGTTATTSAHASAAWYIQRTAGATPVANWSSSISGAYVRATFALRNSTGGRIPAYIDDVTSPGTGLTCGHHVATQNNISFSASGSFIVVATIAGKALTQVAAANGADFGINPYANAITSAAAATPVGNLTGPELVLTGGRNLSAGLIVGSVIAGTPKMGLFGLGSISQGGIVVRVASAVNNWNAYQVSAKDAVITPESRCVFAIQAGYDGSDYAVGSSGNALNTGITYIQLLRNAPSFSSQTYFSEIHYALAHVIAGGDTNFPVDADGLVEIGRSFRIPLIQKAGPNGVVSFVPLQIGGGDAVNFQIDSGSIQFPRRADPSKKDIQFHAADNLVGYKDAGKLGDTVKLTNTTVSSPTPFHFEITTGATNTATRDYTGLSIVGGTVILRNVITFDQINFTSCPTIDISGCTLIDCKITKVAAGNNTLITNGSTSLSKIAINVSGVTAGNYWCSVASPSIFSGCNFVGGGGHAIRITTPGTYTFSGNIFTGFGAGGSTGAAIYNDSGGAVVLNIIGGGSTPTIRNGTGASTTVNSNVSVTLTGLKSGSEVRVYTNNAGNNDVIVDGIESSGTSFTFAVGSGVVVNIMIFHLNYLPADIWGFSTTTDTSVPTSQFVDRQYAAGSGGGSSLIFRERFESGSSPWGFASRTETGGALATLNTGSNAESVNSIALTASAAGTAYLRLDLATAVTDLYFRFTYKCPSAFAFGATNYMKLISFLDASSVERMRINIETNATLDVTTAGTDTQGYTNTGLDLGRDAVNTLEVRYLKNATTGRIVIWHNNNTEGSPSYDSGNINTGTTTIDKIDIGLVFLGEGVTGTFYMDDVRFDDTFIGTRT